MQYLNFNVNTNENVTEIPEIELNVKAVFTEAFSKHISEINFEHLKKDIATAIKNNVILKEVR